MHINPTNHYNILKPTASNLFGCLLLTFLVMILVVGFIQLFFNNLIPSERTAFLLGSSFQAVLAFIFPAWLTAFLCTPKPYEYLGVTEHVKSSEFLIIFVIYLAAVPFLNSMISWNSTFSFPESLSGIETQLREWEDSAAEITQKILNNPSWGALISGILIVGCLTGFAEEMFFRAGLLRAFLKLGINKHVGIWITAIIFSAVHFQFFGFIPRMLIGAFLGYIFVYTQSVWTAAFAHALNNSLTVLMAWLTARGINVSFFETVGTDGLSGMIFSIVSFILSLLLLSAFIKSQKTLKISFNGKE